MFYQFQRSHCGFIRFDPKDPEADSAKNSQNGLAAKKRTARVAAALYRVMQAGSIGCRRWSPCKWMACNM